ncbi:Kelch repeat-containing protein [Nocardiopsis sp. CA-288880]|uniref:Kelch repeat-containing protein n=1 Tax=Nocardiopsis sp. CA-288880 TaxID=3239995 RepID=UPI003D97770F
MKSALGAGLSALALLGASSCDPAEEESRNVTVVGLPPAPVDPRQDHSLVWTGQEVLVWGGHGADQHAPFSDGAAYSPDTGAWRSLADSTLEPRTRHSTVMVGDRMLVWGGFTPTHSGGPDGHTARDGAFYDPEDDSWEPVAQAPEGRSLARGAVSGGHVVFGGGHSEQGDEGFLVYSVEQDAWRTVPLRGGGEGFAVYDLVVADSTVVAVGGSPGGMAVTVFGVDDEAAPARELVGPTEAAEQNVSAGLAVSPEGSVLLAVRGGRSAGVYEIDGSGQAELVGSSEYADFRPPVSAATLPLDAGGMDVVDGLGLLATGPGDVSMWDPATGWTQRIQTEALADHCGPLVPADDGVVFGWGGWGCGSGVRVDIDL